MPAGPDCTRYFWKKVAFPRNARYTRGPHLLENGTPGSPNYPNPNHMNESNFTETRWTRIRRAQDGADPAAAKKAFEGICRDYAPPLYAYARATGLAPEEATRLVNELFYRMTLELFPIHNPDDQLPEIPRDQLPIGMRGATTDATPLLERAEDYRDDNRAKHGPDAGRLRDFFMLQIKTILRTDWRSQLRASQQGAIFSVAAFGLFTPMRG